MKLTIERKELKKAVTGLGRIANGKSALPILGCARFEAGPDHTSAAVTDLDQSARFGFNTAQTEGSGVFVVQMQGLKDVLKTGAGDTVVFEHTGPGAVTASSGGVRLALQSMDPEDWPPEPAAVGTEAAPGFLETYRRLLDFSSTDENRYVLRSVHIDTDGKSATPVTMVSTDGRRLTAVNSMKLPLNDAVTVPVSKFLAWTGLGNECGIGLRYETRKVTTSGREKESEVAIGLAVAAGPWTYQARLIDGVYPNWRQVVPAPNEPCTIAIDFSDADAALLKTALPGFPGTNDSNPAVVIGPDAKGRVTITGCGVDDPEPSTLVLESGSRVAGTGRIAVDPRYLRDALAAGFRRFEANDDLSPLKSEDGKGGVHVLMPVRLSDTKLKPEPTEPQDKDTPVEAVKAQAKPQHTDPAGPEAAQAETSNPKIKEPGMSTKRSPNPTTDPADVTETLDRFQSVADAAKAKARETLSALTELTRMIKTIGREHKAQGSDLEKARQTLRKLRDIKL